MQLCMHRQRHQECLHNDQPYTTVGIFNTTLQAQFFNHGVHEQTFSTVAFSFSARVTIAVINDAVVIAIAFLENAIVVAAVIVVTAVIVRTCIVMS